MTEKARKKAKPVLSVRLTNRWAAFECPPEVQGQIKSFFRFRPPGHEFSPAFRAGGWDGWTNLHQRGRVASGLFLARRADMEKEWQLRVRDERAPLQFVAGDLDLRPYQERALAAMVAASAVGGIVLSATGSGKTRLAAAYFKRLAGAACFVVDELTLLEQTRRALAEQLREEIGVVGRSEFSPRRISVATVQTLHRHRNRADFQRWFKVLDAMIIDELHVMLGRRNADVVQQIRPRACFGLTATLEVEKPHVWMPAVALCGPVVFEYPLSEGVDEGFLSGGVVCDLRFHDPLRGEAPAYPTTDAMGRRTWIAAGAPAAEYRRHASLNATRNALVAALAEEGARRGRRTVVLVEHKLHLRKLDVRLAGVEHATLSGDVPTRDRLEAMRRMDAGELPLILTTRVFAKGVDISSVDMIVDATGVPSRNNALQRYGRGARRAEGKGGLIYVSVADRGSPLARAARSRLRALRETKSPVVEMDWRGDAEEVLIRCERVLRLSPSPGTGTRR